MAPDVLARLQLWVYGEQFWAVFDNVLLAEYHCRDDWRDRNVKEIRQGVFYPTRLQSRRVPSSH